MKILALIPARMGSSRFPGKPLKKILGKPMIGHVFDNVKKNELLNKVSKTRSFGNIQSDLEKNPNSLDLKYELALSQIANEEYEDSIENLLNIYKIDKSWENGKAKDQLILLFDTLGNKNELVLKARRKLSSIIFS